MEKLRKKYLPSFAGRLSRRLSPNQKKILNDILPQVQFSLTRFLESNSSYKRVAVEVGFGGGEHLIEQSTRNPNTLFIGCEPFVNGIVKVLHQIKTKQVQNILIYNHDARDIFEQLPKDSTEVVYVLFPDPWPKTKHKKRRIINLETLKLIHHILKPRAELIIATDHEDYAEHILLEVLNSKLYDWPLNALHDLNIQPQTWVQTKYETKAKAVGSRIYYFKFIKIEC